jgi:hypothetical protein
MVQTSPLKQLISTQRLATENPVGSDRWSTVQEVADWLEKLGTSRLAQPLTQLGRTYPIGVVGHFAAVVPGRIGFRGSTSASKVGAAPLAPDDYNGPLLSQRGRSGQRYQSSGWAAPPDARSPAPAYQWATLTNNARAWTKWAAEWGGSKTIAAAL